MKELRTFLSANFFTQSFLKSLYFLQCCSSKVCIPKVKNSINLFRMTLLHPAIWLIPGEICHRNSSATLRADHPGEYDNDFDPTLIDIFCGEQVLTEQNLFRSFLHLKKKMYLGICLRFAWYLPVLVWPLTRLTHIHKFTLSLTNSTLDFQY